MKYLAITVEPLISEPMIVMAVREKCLRSGQKYQILHRGRFYCVHYEIDRLQNFRQIFGHIWTRN